MSGAGGVTSTPTAIDIAYLIRAIHVAIDECRTIRNQTPEAMVRSSMAFLAGYLGVEYPAIGEALKQLAGLDSLPLLGSVQYLDRYGARVEHAAISARFDAAGAL